MAAPIPSPNCATVRGAGWERARASALPAPRREHAQADSDTVALEPLSPLRHPTMWPQRPKRLTDEIFSSWLWRTAVAAGVPPYRFARDVLGAPGDDVDRDVAPATLRRLAQLSGQTFEHLAGGTLFETVIGTQETPAGLAEDALLRDGRFLLNGAKPDRLGRPRPVLQYCPRCLETDARPHFRRGWRFAHAVVCVDHGCRLHDRCWACGGAITPLASRVVDARPRCRSAQMPGSWRSAAGRRNTCAATATGAARHAVLPRGPHCTRRAPWASRHAVGIPRQQPNDLDHATRTKPPRPPRLGPERLVRAADARRARRAAAYAIHGCDVRPAGQNRGAATATRAYPGVRWPPTA